MDFATWITTYGQDAQFALFFGLLLVLGLAEHWAPRVARQSRRLARWPANFGLTTLNILTLSLLPISFVTAAEWGGQQGWGLLHLVTLPLPVLAAANLLLRGLISFGTHFLMHWVPFFWRVHRVHHLDTVLDVSTTVRFHPLEFVISLIVGLPVVAAIGFTPWLLLTYELLDVAVTLFSHSNVRLPSGLHRLMRYVVVTPELHHIHHSTWWREANSNFGAVFPVWDILFGTFLSDPRQGYERMEIGLKEVRDTRSDNLPWLVKSPFLYRLSDRTGAQSGLSGGVLA